MKNALLDKLSSSAHILAKCASSVGCCLPLREHRAAVLCLAWKSDVLVTGSFDTHVRQFDLRGTVNVCSDLSVLS